jgi:hypothetical protein
MLRSQISFLPFSFCDVAEHASKDVLAVFQEFTE